MTTRREPPVDPVELKLGYGERIVTRKMDVPPGDAPPWDATTKHTVVGTDHDRVDGLPKASGRAKYTYDVTFPGMLHGMILRSPVARGTLKELELDAALEVDGVAAVIALKDVGARVRFVGDELAAVAARSLDACRDALERIRAGFDAEPHRVDFLQSPDAPALDDAGDVADAFEPHEAIDAALAAAATTVAGTYRTEVQTHSSLETHGAVAKWTGDDLEVWSSTQATFGVRGELMTAMKAAGQKCDSVTVHAEFVGGGFGSKFGAGAEGRAAALLARAANAPVKLMLDRFEEHTCTGNRPSALMQIRGGCDDKGRIVAFDWRSFGGCGHNGGGGGVTFPAHFVRGAKQRRAHKDIACDTDPARPMRAPGWPQGYFGGELFLDELAVAAGMDPLQFRLANDEQPTRQDQYRAGAKAFGWTAARNARPGTPRDGDDPRWLRGAGMASARWGGMGGAGRDTPHGITCRIHQDGTVETRSGAQDIGTGMKTVMAVLTAEELQIPTSRIKAFMGHTGDPSGPGSGGSTTTPSLSPAVRHAAFLAKERLRGVVARHLGVPEATVRCAGGNVGAEGAMLAWTDACKLIGPNPIETHGERLPNYRGEPFQDGVCGVQFAEVLVDTWTGVVRVLRTHAEQDCGLVIAKKLAESQVLGAMIQGIGYALHEQRIMDRRSGRMLNGDFLRYKVPGPKDVPELSCTMWSIANGHTNTGAVGLGEPPSVAAPAAVANAVFNAVGVPLRHLPITPDKVLRALAARPAAARSPR